MRQTGLTSNDQEEQTDGRTGKKAVEPDSNAPGAAVVGLGGSAGALEAFNAFFAAMPPDTGAAFVVIQHLAPNHESMLPELLARQTQMRVLQATDGMLVEPNCVYVIPPRQDLGIRDGALYLAEPVKQKGIRLPIDFFLRTLAEDRQEKAVCILFSGTGSDGTMGLRAIRGAGGLTIAQDPQHAQYGDMPRSAIATGLVDCVLSPHQMPGAIVEYLRQPYVRGGAPAAILEAEGKLGDFNEILAVVRTQTDCDFRCYKKSTIIRRIERRMGLLHIPDMAQYKDLLRLDSGEVRQLLKDLLINVTAFFRDDEAFKELHRMALTPMIQDRQTDQPLRVWVTGCSSGEEVYSLAMLLMEEMSANHKNYLLQIFATDIDEDALQIARKGVYPESIAADITPDRLAKFFIKTDKGYQVIESLRNSIVFTLHNLITDPPFSKMDLVSCRNLLIYLDAGTQAKLIPLFNFALNPGGYLFLGKSEGISGQSDLFALVSKKARLYRSCPPVRPILLDSPLMSGKRRTLPSAGLVGKLPAAIYADAIRQVLLGHFAASVVLVGPKGQILQFHGQTGKYLNMPATEPNLNLLDIAKDGISLTLRSALHTAITETRPVVLDGVPVTREEGAPCARVTIIPLWRGSARPETAGGECAATAEGRGETEQMIAVIFEDVARQAFPGDNLRHGGESEVTVKQLEDELRLTQQDLQASAQDLQASNEEMRISNEEVVSANEELQSTNEELETSKEELQSANEELTTVNSQLHEKVDQLDASCNDMSNLLKSTQIATLFLDSELRIKFFTPATTRVLKLIASDKGRSVSDLATSFVNFDLEADARAVIQSGSVVERDVRHVDGSIFLVRVMPYRTQNDRLDGVVVTFDDVSRLRRAAEDMRTLATVVTDSDDAVILFDVNGNIQAWNRGAQSMYGWNETEAVRMNIRDITPAGRPDETPDLVRRLITGEQVKSHESQRCTKDGRVLDVWLTLTAVRDEFKVVVTIASTERDVPQLRQAEAAVRKSENMLARAQRVANFGSWEWNVRSGEIIWSDQMYRIFEEERGSFVPTYDSLMTHLHPDDRGRVDKVISDAVASRRRFEIECRVVGKKGDTRVVQAKADVLLEDNLVVRVIGTAADITERRHTEEALRANEQKLRFHFENSPLAVVEWDANFIVTQWSGEAERIFGWKKEETIGKRIDSLNIIYREDMPLVNNTMERLTSGKERMVVSSNRNLTKRGAVIECAWHNTVLFDSNGKMASVLSLVEDITERKEVENKIRQHAEEMRVANEELSRFNRVAVGRELRMVELKQQVNELCGQLGKPQPYNPAIEKKE